MTATGSGNTGIFVTRTTGALLSGNTVTNNTSGIMLSGTTGALLAGNTATNNGPRDNLFFNSDSNRVVGNTATGNRTIGIQVEPGSTGNQFLGNTATGNNPDLSDGNPPACVNTWQRQHLCDQGRRRRGLHPVAGSR